MPRCVFYMALPLLLLPSACGPSEEEIEAEFNSLVARTNECKSADECAIVIPGCPLGCFVAVNRAHRAKVAEAAEELISDYESGGSGCVYDCALPGELACTAGRCEVSAAP